MYFENLSWLLMIIAGCFVWAVPVWGQDTLSFPVHRVVYSGLDKTKEAHLNAVLRLYEHPDLSANQIEAAAQKLRNLNSIASADVLIDTLEKGLQVTFQIEEARTLFPILNFGSVRGNTWFQAGFNDINWLGKGIQMSAFYRNNDNRNNFNFYYRVPYIKGSKWGGSFNFFRWASVEPLFFDEGEVRFDYDNLSFGLTALHEFKTGHHIDFGGSFFIEHYRKSNDQPLENPPGPDSFRQPKILGKVVHTLNKINYNYYKAEGFDNTTMIETVYNTLDRDWFFIVLNDFRYFKILSNSGNLALRLRTGISSNRNTPFAPFVLDSNINIRGSGNRIDRGTAQAILNLEYRHTVWDNGNQKFAVQMVAFSDLGTWRNPGGTLEDLFDADNFRHFVGGGVRLVYKKAFNSILRLDYGIDLYNSNERGLVMGIGQYF